jgi:hypothetical protein
MAITVKKKLGSFMFFILLIYANKSINTPGKIANASKNILFLRYSLFAVNSCHLYLLPFIIFFTFLDVCGQILN